MLLVDSHCHLDFPEFAQDLDDVVRRAGEQGVAAIVTVGTSVSSSRQCVEIAHKYSGVFASVGIHPSEAASADSASLRELEALARDQRVVAVGETGLDYHYGRDSAVIQQEVFRWHLDLASRTGLPLIVHQRESAQDLMRILGETPAPCRTVFHCFGGDALLAAFCLERGYFVSFTGILTFRNAQSVRDAASAFPLERVLVETDAPYLSPAPLRGRRNEPSRVRFVLEKLASVRSLDPEACAAQVWANACVFFNLHPA